MGDYAKKKDEAALDYGDQACVQVNMSVERMNVEYCLFICKYIKSIKQSINQVGM